MCPQSKTFVCTKALHLDYSGRHLPFIFFEPILLKQANFKRPQSQTLANREKREFPPLSE